MLESKHSSWIQYKGKDIFYCDYRNLRGQEYLEAIDENLSYAKSLGQKKLLILTDIRESTVNIDVTRKLKEISESLEDITEKMALIGIFGLKKIFFNALNRLTKMNSKAFNDIEDAKNWLAE